MLSSKIKTVDLLKLLSQGLSLTAMWESTFSIQECSWGLWTHSVLMGSRLTSFKSAEFNSLKPQVGGLQGNDVHTKGIGKKEKKKKKVK